jgi:hypothetical protein
VGAALTRGEQGAQLEGGMEFLGAIEAQDDVSLTEADRPTSGAGSVARHVSRDADHGGVAERAWRHCAGRTARRRQGESAVPEPSGLLPAQDATAFGGDLLFPGDFRQELNLGEQLRGCRLIVVTLGDTPSHASRPTRAGKMFYEFSCDSRPARPIANAPKAASRTPGPIASPIQ